MILRAGILVFPGTNCERDTYYALSERVGIQTDLLWYASVDSFEDYGLVVIPGGFSFGDYLRAGKLAALTPVIERLREFERTGGLILGICNGFQILTEAGLVSGTLLKNKNGRFISKWCYVRVEDNTTPFTNMFENGEVCKLPIAHFNGAYYYNKEDKPNVVFRYCSPDGEPLEAYNPDGTMDNIAGVVSRSRRICGIMPHPERAVEVVLGSSDGMKIFLSILNYLEKCRG